MNALPSMTSSMLRVRPSTEVREPENPPSIPVHSMDDAPMSAFDLGTAISLALSRAGLSHKQACAHMDLDASLWSRQIQGKDAHVSMQRLQKLPAVFWREFLPLLGGPMRMTLATQDAADMAMLRIVTLVQEIGSYALQIRALDQRRTA